MQIKHLHREYKIRGKQSLIESHLCSVLQNHTSLCTNCFPIVPIWKHQKHISNVLLSPFVHFLLSFSGCVLASLPLCCLKSTCGGFPAGLVRSLWIISAALGLFLTLPAPHPRTPHTHKHTLFCGQSQTRVTLNNFNFSCILMKLWCFNMKTQIL